MMGVGSMIIPQVLELSKNEHFFPWLDPHFFFTDLGVEAVTPPGAEI